MLVLRVWQWKWSTGFLRQVINGGPSFPEVAWGLQFVPEGVCVPPNRPGTLSKRKVCGPFLSLTLLLRTLTPTQGYSDVRTISPPALSCTLWSLHHLCLCLALFYTSVTLFFFEGGCPSHNNGLIFEEIMLCWVPLVTRKWRFDWPGP